MYDEKARKIFSMMIKNGLIPEKGQFEITDRLIDISYKIGNSLHKKSERKRSPSDIRLHKKIAGINFLHLNNERAEIENKNIFVKKQTVIQHSGILYIIENTSFPDHIKVGITKNLNKRLANYQTYDPHRNFKILKYIFVQNVRDEEKYLLNKYKIKDVFTGEWLTRLHLDELSTYMNNKL
jgi:hypothetical protein